MAHDNIHKLIERYFDGETSLDEEQQIARYFEECSELPDDLIPVREMFISMSQLRQTESPITPLSRPNIDIRRRRSAWLGGIGIVAAAASIVFGIVVFGVSEEVAQPIKKAPDIICHIDGKRIYDMDAAQQATTKTLNILSDNMLSAIAEVEKIGIKYY